MNCQINNGLSEASQKELLYKTGEQIVTEDLENQMKQEK